MDRTGHEPIYEALFQVFEQGDRDLHAATIGVSWPASLDEKPRVQIRPAPTKLGLRFLGMLRSTEAVTTDAVEERLSRLQAVAVSAAQSARAIGWLDSKDHSGVLPYFHAVADMTLYATFEDPSQVAFDEWIRDPQAIAADVVAFSRWLAADQKEDSSTGGDEVGGSSVPGDWRPEVETSATIEHEWISVLEISPDADGVEGGPWRLTVTRLTDGRGSQWWPWAEDDESPWPLSTMVSGKDVIMVRLASDLPFAEAAAQYGLDAAVFGSPTLWPGAHMSHGASNGGWVWLHGRRPSPFPFSSKNSREATSV